MITHSFTSLRAPALALALLASALAAQAQLAFTVRVDTSALAADPLSPYYVDFQLNDGSGLGNANAHATLSDFSFGGGSALGIASHFGGASGDVASSIQLTDTDAFNESFQAFLPGQWLSFSVQLNYTPEDVFPDQFTFALLDASLANLATESFFGNDVLLQVDLDSAQPAVWTFASLDGAVPAPAVVPVPEPSTYALSGALVLLLLALRRHSKRA